MKYVIVIEDGASDYPIDEIDGKTPLKIAEKPVLDKIAREGRTGLIQNVPETLPPGSDVANMSIFGYDPLDYYTGRGPLEAASMGIETKEGDVVFRCNTITERDGLMASSNAGHISSEESAELMEYLNQYFNERLIPKNFLFHYCQALSDSLIYWQIELFIIWLLSSLII